MNIHKNCGLIIIFGLLANLLLLSQHKPLIEVSQGNSKTYQFTNGRWFDGREFKPMTFYAVNGVLTSQRPSQIEESIDLNNGFVVPPFGDAHCHHFSGKRGLENLIQSYLKEGIFYSKMLANSPEGADEASDKLNRVDSVDVLFANGCLTGSYSHPMGIYEGLALGFYTRKQRHDNREKIRDSRLAEGHAYYNIDSKDELENKWPLILATRPGIIKIILSDSKNFERDKNNIEMDSRRGLDPKLVPLVVTKAHAAGLRVIAHVDTAADFHLALTAGVDEMAHMPGYYILPEEDIKNFEISEADVKLAAKRKIIVTPTANWVEADPDEKHRAKVKDIQIHNLRLLKKHGMRIVLGSDYYGASSSKEAFYLHSLGIYNNLELLKSWCEITPQNIFPKRKLGRLIDGYEASFIVLADNPLENFESVKTINYRFKQGVPIK